MSIYVSCQCGQAFSAPEELAGQTLPCPMCQRPIAVLAQSPAPVAAPPVATGGPFASHTPFQSMPAAPAPLHPAQPAVRGEEDSPLVVWLSVIGGGLALMLVIGLLVYNATRRTPTPVATTTTAAAPSTPSPVAPSVAPPASSTDAAATPAATSPPTPAPPTPAPMPAAPMTNSEANPSQQESSQPPVAPATATTLPPATELPAAAQIPVATQLPGAGAPAAADPKPEAAAFTPPGYGGMVATPDGKYEVWLPSAPQKFDPALDLSSFLPKPAGKVLLAFGKQGPTEMCSISVTPDAKAADIYAELERAFPGQPDTKTIKFAGVDARQYDFAIEITEGKFVIRTIAFAIDGTGYTLQTLSITGQADTDENKAFFASFRKKKQGE